MTRLKWAVACMLGLAVGVVMTTAALRSHEAQARRVALAQFQAATDALAQTQIAIKAEPLNQSASLSFAGDLALGGDPEHDTSDFLLKMREELVTRTQRLKAEAEALRVRLGKVEAAAQRMGSLLEAFESREPAAIARPSDEPALVPNATPMPLGPPPLLQPIDSSALPSDPGKDLLPPTAPDESKQTGEASPHAAVELNPVVPPQVPAPPSAPSIPEP